MKKLAVFGGSQGVGKEFIKQALEQGYSVCALARTPSKLDDIVENRDQLKIIHGDVLLMEDVKKTLQGQDAVVLSLGATFGSNSDPHVCSKGTKLVIDAMKEQQLKRVVCVSSFGVGDSWQDAGFFARFFLKWILGRIFTDKEEQEQDLKASGLDWTILRPGGLGYGPATGQFRVGEHITGGRINRADVASVILKDLKDNEWIFKTPTVVG